MPLITSPHFYIFHSSTSYPSHSPHHRPIPRSRTIFPPDPDTKQSNLTKGTKNTTDPTAKRDQKAEFSATVTTNSLAAEPLRSGGGFPRGKPTVYIAVTAENSTLNTTSGGKVREIHGKKSDEECYSYNEARVDPKKSAEAGTSRGGVLTNHSFALDPEGGPIKEALGGGSAGDSAIRLSQTAHGRSDTSRESTRDDGRHGGNRGEGDKGPKQSAGSGPTGEVNMVAPNTPLGGRVKGPGLRSSEIPRDTGPVAGVGVGGGSGRAAESHLVKQSAKREQGFGDVGGGIESAVAKGSIFDYLRINENA
ncbi:hypothetical protein HOY80DRAFT_981095 [Tuber brumale]|nr:hypothetical protein HOY80DRAFT_981095 [Tuber brumale]